LESLVDGLRTILDSVINQINAYIDLIYDFVRYLWTAPDYVGCDFIGKFWHNVWEDEEVLYFLPILFDS